MSTYQELKGLKIKYLSSDTSGDRLKEGEIFYNSTDFKLKSFISSAAWHSGGSLLTARNNGSGAGTMTAGLAVGGNFPDNMRLVEEYNGSGWASATNSPYDAQLAASIGTQTAAATFGGISPPGQHATTVEYDGTNWTSGGDLNTARAALTGCGTQTAGLATRGDAPNPSPPPDSTGGQYTEEYNGTSWTNGNNTNDARRNSPASFGTQTAAVACGGGDPSESPSATTEEYDGTNWTSVNNMNTARLNLAGAGILTSGIIFGGQTGPGGGPVTNATEQYDGTNWTTAPNMGTARAQRAGTRAGSNQTEALAHGGYTTTQSAATEEFSVSLTATTGAAFASGGNTVNARRNAGCMGTQTAGLYAGGFGPPYLNYSEEYNGTSWTEGNNTTIARECSTSGFGTQTAGAIAGGGAPDNITSPYGGYSNSTDEYNGTSWSEGGNMNSHRLGMATCGTQTAGFGAGGYQGANHPESPPPNTAKCEQYDGTSWTEVADLNTARSSMGHFGTQTASIACRGSSNPTESWDGSSWTNISASPIVFNGGNHGGGTQTAGITYGPRTYNATELWDGTTWVTSAKYSTSRGGNCAGDASDGLLVGGYTGTANSNATEEFTGETTAARAVKTIDFD
jgi:hypothetical protein